METALLSKFEVVSFGAGATPLLLRQVQTGEVVAECPEHAVFVERLKTGLGANGSG